MVAGIYSRTRIIRMLEVRRKLRSSVDHIPATPVWLFASEHSATSLHTWELHSARFAKLNTCGKKVTISRLFYQVFGSIKEACFSHSKPTAAKHWPGGDWMEHRPRNFLGRLLFIQITLTWLVYTSFRRVKPSRNVILQVTIAWNPWTYAAQQKR